MIITDKHIFLNFPKTGSTFIREVLKQIYKWRNQNQKSKTVNKIKGRDLYIEEFLMPHYNLPEYKDQHGAWDQIPLKHKNKHVISVARNPVDRFISLYRFQ